MSIVNKFGLTDSLVAAVRGVMEGKTKAGMPSSVMTEAKSKHRPLAPQAKRYSQMTPQEFARAHADKTDEVLRSMAWRYGYGKGSNYYVDKRNKGRQGVAEGAAALRAIAARGRSSLHHDDFIAVAKKHGYTVTGTEPHVEKDAFNAAISDRVGQRDETHLKHESIPTRQVRVVHGRQSQSLLARALPYAVSVSNQTRKVHINPKSLDAELKKDALDGKKEIKEGVAEEPKKKGVEPITTNPQLKEMSIKERTAFHMAAAAAKRTSKSHFMFAGKKFPVKMSGDVAKQMTSEDAGDKAYVDKRGKVVHAPSAEVAAERLNTSIENIRIAPSQTAESQTSGYFRRREREEKIISGEKPARKRQPSQTSGYFRRREREEKIISGEKPARKKGYR